MIKAFDYLDAPVLNCTGKDVPMPQADNLEKAALITPDEIVFSFNLSERRFDELSKLTENAGCCYSLIANDALCRVTSEM